MCYKNIFLVVSLHVHVHVRAIQLKRLLLILASNTNTNTSKRHSYLIAGDVTLGLEDGAVSVFRQHGDAQQAVWNGFRVFPSGW